MALTSQIRYIRVYDPDNVTPVTGLTFNNFVAAYVAQGGTLTALTTEDITTLGTYQAPSSAAHIRIKQLSEESPSAGVYEVHLHDTQLASEKIVTFLFEVTDKFINPLEVQPPYNLSIAAHVSQGSQGALFSVGGHSLPDMPVADNETLAVENVNRWSELNELGIPVEFPNGTIYLDGTVTTPPTYGCGVMSTKAGYAITPVWRHPTLTGILTRFEQLGECVTLRLSGGGFVANGAFEWMGHLDYPIIEIEGRLALCAGSHRFQDNLFTNATCAFNVLAGYYEDGVFVADENHGENVICRGCGFGIDAMHCYNQQSMGWRFYDCQVMSYPGVQPIVFADIQRGGDVGLFGLEIFHEHLTLFKVHEYSPNNCRFQARNFHRDRCLSEDNYLTIFEYAGGPAAESSEWLLIADGWLAVHQTHFDEELLYQIPETMPTTSWQRNVQLTGSPL